MREGAIQRRPLAEIATSVASGTTTSRDARGLNPLYGSTGRIGSTNRAEYTGPSILVARVGANAGSVYAVDGTYGVTDNTLAIRLRPGNNVTFVSEFLEHAQLNRMVYGSGQPLVTGTMLKRLEVPDFSPAEQARIADVLDDSVAHIVTLERKIAKKQAIKRGMIQHLLTGKTRLPGYTGSWRQVRLGSLGKCIRGVGYDPREDLSSGDRPFTVRLLRSNNVHDGRIEREGLQFVHERRVSAAQSLTSGDIVICMANGSRALVGKAAMFDGPASGPRYTFGAFMGVFRTDGSVASPRFVLEMMRTHEFRNWLDMILSGSSINNLRPSDVEGFVAQLPDRTEQLAIAEVLGDADAEIDQLRERLAKARAVKTGMMQELLTGRTRLPFVEGAA